MVFFNAETTREISKYCGPMGCLSAVTLKTKEKTLAIMLCSQVSRIQDEYLL